jgi:hypothetical protein
MTQTFEVIKRDGIAESTAAWLSGPIAGKGLDSELRYMSGVYGDSIISYLPTATARQMAKDGRLRDFRNRDKCVS